MPRLGERLVQHNKPFNSFPASTGQDSCRRVVRIVDIDHAANVGLLRNDGSGMEPNKSRDRLSSRDLSNLINLLKKKTVHPCCIHVASMLHPCCIHVASMFENKSF
jgi:hypothetical protein